MSQQENEENMPEEVPVKKFTPFQVTIVVLLAVLVVVLIGFLIVYAVKDSDSQKNDGEDVEVQKTANEKIVDTTAVPPRVTQDTRNAANESMTEEATPSKNDSKPDLYVKSYELGETPTIGDKFTAKIMIANKGATAKSFAWEWWSTSSEHDCKGEIDSLAAGAVKTVECDHTYDSADEYSTKFIVDTKDSINESDENNNVTTKKIIIAKKADLYISEYEFDHDPKQGEEFTVRMKIKNKGGTDAEDFYWEWWPTVTGSKACREKIDKLEVGDSETVECDYTYGGWANYTTKGVVDADDDVDEDKEDNNTYTKNVTPIH